MVLRRYADTSILNKEFKETIFQGISKINPPFLSEFCGITYQVRKYLDQFVASVIIMALSSGSPASRFIEMRSDFPL